MWWRRSCHSHHAPNPTIAKAVTSVRTRRPMSTFCQAPMIRIKKINERVGKAQHSWQQLAECLKKRKECRDQRHNKQRRRMHRRNYLVYGRQGDNRHALCVLACERLPDPQDPYEAERCKQGRWLDKLKCRHPKAGLSWMRHAVRGDG